MALLIHSFVLCPPGYSSVTRVFDWLAISDGSLLHVFTCAVFRWVLLYKCCIALAYSSGVRQTHLFDEPGDFWDSCHQNACVGERIQKKNSTHTKVGRRNLVLNVDSECNCIHCSCNKISVTTTHRLLLPTSEFYGYLIFHFPLMYISLFLANSL